MTGFRLTRLTGGTDRQRFHSHAYYDIPVFDSTSRFIAGHQVRFQGRQPGPDDEIRIGYIDLEGERRWHSVGTSRAWSWQQGAMSQWLPGSRRLIWNDREGDGFVARVHDLDTGSESSLPLPVYAIDPRGRFTLSLNMARLDLVRPGYGYPGAQSRMDEMRPADDGVWRLDLGTGERRLVLSLERAVEFLMSRLSMPGRLRHRAISYVYWFNHAKISPDGQRFTVKLRFRHRGLRRGWSDRMGVSLTCGMDGSDLRLLAAGTSHVMWLDRRRLYLWRPGGIYLYSDEAPVGSQVARIAPELIRQNVHIRHQPDRPSLFVFDTPYGEVVNLFLHDTETGATHRIATFANHRPESGLFRCDLHPCPSPDARKIVVTSLHDGGRQIYLLERQVPE